MAVIRLDDESDNIESTLSLALMDPKAAASTNKSTSVDTLASSTWDKVFSHSQLVLTYGIKKPPTESELLFHVFTVRITSPVN